MREDELYAIKESMGNFLSWFAVHEREINELGRWMGEPPEEVILTILNVGTNTMTERKHQDLELEEVL